MFRMNRIFAVAALAVAAVQAAPVTFGSHTYDLIRANGLSWAQASAAAAALGAGWHLATITTQAEQDFIRTSVIGNHNGGEFWLGGYQDPATSGITANWVWVTGEAWSYTAWNPGEPNDHYGTYSESHLGIWGSGNWKWNDEGNLGNITGYILEHTPETVPEPGSLILLGMGLAGLGVAYRRRRKA